MEDKEILEGLKTTNCPYDFIANNYWKMSHEQLKDLLLEIIAITDTDTIKDCVVEGLVEYKGWEE